LGRRDGKLRAVERCPVRSPADLSKIEVMNEAELEGVSWDDLLAELKRLA
jgi:hypothetical protein